MIDVNSLGAELSSSFKSKMGQRVLNESNGPREQIIFARKLPSLLDANRTVWVSRDVSKMFFNAEPIVKSIADNYGTSKGAEVAVVFDNTPTPMASSVLMVNGKISSFLINTDPLLNFEAGDWIEISDYNHVEYRRLGIVDVHTDDNYTELTLTLELDNDFDVMYTEIRYLFALENGKERLDTYDLYNGFLQMNLGFEDETDYLTLFQGEIIGGARDPNSTVTLTLQDKVKSLVETQLVDRFEIDDRGVASVPTAKGWNNEVTSKLASSQIFGAGSNSLINDAPNVGTGEMTDVVYASGKLNEIDMDQEWSFTYDASSDRFHWWGAGLPDGSGEEGFGTLDGEGVPSSGLIGSRVWEIDLSDDFGWSVSIIEGDIPFETGDQFVFYTYKYVEDMAHVVKGRGFESSPVSTLDGKYMNPSYVIETLIKDVLELSHENIVTGASSDLLINLDPIRRLDLDFRTDLRGVFDGGTSVIQVIDDALRTVNGWIYSTHDDHIRIFHYSPFALGDYDRFEISTDYDAPLPRSQYEYPNAADPQVEPRATDSVKNQVFFSHANGEVFVDDAESQENFGRFKLDVRGEDLITHQISSAYEISNNTARNAAQRALQRYKNPIFRATFMGMPSLLLLEIGDIPRLFSREVQFVNRPFWVTGLEVDFTALVVRVTGELATQITGKYGQAHGPSDPEVNVIWDATGFIGQDGEERLAYLADDISELDGIRHPNNMMYDQRVGRPDQWGNYVEDPFVLA